MAYCTIVTGAASGIGAAVAAELTRRGEPVFAVDRAGGDLALDLTAPDAVARLGEAVLARYEGVRGFVHCAGFDAPAPLWLVKSETVRELAAVHALFPIAFFGWLQQPGHHAPGAACVLVSSLAVHEGAKGHVAYAAAKGAVEGILKPAAAELVARDIRLNAVVLGVVATAMSRGWLGKLPDDARAALERTYPLGFGDPAAVAKAIAFLLSGDAAWITGQTLVCDGGHSLT